MNSIIMVGTGREFASPVIRVEIASIVIHAGTRVTDPTVTFTTVTSTTAETFTTETLTTRC